MLYIILLKTTFSTTYRLTKHASHHAAQYANPHNRQPNTTYYSTRHAVHHTTQNPAQQTAVDNKLWNLLGWPPNTKSCPIAKLPNTTRGATCYLAGRPHNILSNSVLCNMLPNWSPNTKCYPSNPSTHHTAQHNTLWNILSNWPIQNAAR